MEASNQTFEDTYRPFAKMLTDMISKNKSTSVANALASIYTSDESHPKFRYSGLNGLLSLEIDRQLKATFLRMYNLDTLDVIFECETYYGFDENYRKVRSKIYAFDMLDGIIAFDFRTPEEAETMFLRIKTHSKKMTELKAIDEKRRQEEKEKKEANTFFGKIKGKLFHKDTGGEKQEETKILKVQKKNWISFDQKTGKFDADNIPPEWGEIFSKLGYGKKELEDEKLAGELMKDIMVYHTVKEAEEDPSKKQEVLHANARNSYRASFKDLQLPQAPQLPHLPPPPPLANSSALLLPPPALEAPVEDSRNDLLAEICKGNFKLKPVSKQGSTVNVDASKMNKDEREDMTNYLLNAIKRRNQQLHQYDQEEYDTVHV